MPRSVACARPASHPEQFGLARPPPSLRLRPSPRNLPGCRCSPLPVSCSESHLSIQTRLGWLSCGVEIRWSLEGREGEEPAGRWPRIPGQVPQRTDGPASGIRSPCTAPGFPSRDRQRGGQENGSHRGCCDGLSAASLGVICRHMEQAGRRRAGLALRDQGGAVGTSSLPLLPWCPGKVGAADWPGGWRVGQ